MNAKGPKYSKKMLVQKEEVALATTFDDILPKLEDFLKGNAFITESKWSHLTFLSNSYSSQS